MECFTAHQSAANHKPHFEEVQRNWGTAVVLLDFAENDSFVVQDADQGLHWKTVRPHYTPFAFIIELWRTIAVPQEFLCTSSKCGLCFCRRLMSRKTFRGISKFCNKFVNTNFSSVIPKYGQFAARTCTVGLL
jgi:hypothetical protein